MEIKKDFALFKYPNGLRLITAPMESTKSITVLVMVATGSRYETPQINGISHFLEHMMFKGTTKRPGALDISQELDSIGAEYNAFTSKEYTGYYVKCATEKLDTAIDLISDIFQNSKFDADEIEKEKGVIIEEVNMYLDTPARYVGDIFEELLYPDQPLGYLTQGQKEIIKALTRKDFTDYFNTHYIDKNTVVVVAGNIDSDSVKSKIEKSFSNVRTNPTPSLFKKATEAQSQPALRAHWKQTDQTHFILGFRGYNYFAEQKSVVDVISLILSGGMSSRLFEEFRNKRGLAYYVHAFNNPYADVGYFAIGAGVDNARFTEALAAAINECKKIVTTPVPEFELKKVKDYVRGKTAIGLEGSDDVASFYADQELLKNEILTLDEKMALIDKVSSDDIQKISKQIFRQPNLNLAFIGPFKEDNPEINKIINSW